MSCAGDFKRYYIYDRQGGCFVQPASVKNLIMFYLKIYSEGKKWEKM